MARKYLPIGMILFLMLLLTVTVWNVSAAPGDMDEPQSPTLAWSKETVDNQGGQHTSLALNSTGLPRISYYDPHENDLKYAYTYPGLIGYPDYTWHIETVDTNGGRDTSLALDSGNRPHISYCGGGDLKYAYYDGYTWQIESVDQTYSCQYTSLALDSTGRPHISYYEMHTGLKYAYYDGATWQIEAVGGDSMGGQYNSLALDSADHPHISYGHTDGLKYAHHDGATWQIETVDSAVGTGQFTSLALDSAGQPHISYRVWIVGRTLADQYCLKYAHYDGSWHTETVDYPTSVDSNTSLALDSANHPHISYYADTYDNLKYAYYDGSAWQVETVDVSGDVGKYTSLALDISGQRHISYFDDTNNDLKYARNVPLSISRWAAQLLEDMHGTPMAPGWEDMPRLGSVVPLYRPDVEGVAYYEFQVQGTSAPYNRGFIVVAMGDHDFPIPHWNFEGHSPTEELIALAEGQGFDVTKLKFYKLDALTYAAEDETGTQAVTLGDPPKKITGMELAWLDDPVDPTEATWIPDQKIPDDTNAGEISGTLVISGPASPPSLQVSEWTSWDELKAGYSDSYGVLAESLHREASEEWEILSQISQDGEDLFKGDIRQVAMLWMSPTVSLSGSGAGYVQGELKTRDGLPPVYQITVLDSSPGEALPLVVAINYPNGMTEQVNFRIVELYKVWLPLVLRNASGGTSLQVQSPKEIKHPEGWTSWTHYWAGSHSDQRLYDQIPAGTPPNTSSCLSGCGATAWAMLFGWADYQASIGNAYWAPRWGLYRENGGYGANAVAPRDMDDGVRNMIWEIHNRIQTFCIFGSGATWPWKMDNAAGYLAGRTGTSLSTHYSSVGIPWYTYRDRASSSIKDRGTPVVIGTGWLEHYPLAYGYKYRKYKVWGVTWYTQRKFYVNQGWGNSGSNGWVSARTWFVGQIFP